MSKLDKYIEFMVGEFQVDVLEEVGDVFAPKKADGSPERKQLLALIGTIQPHRKRLEEAITALLKVEVAKANKQLLEELNDVGIGGDAIQNMRDINGWIINKLAESDRNAYNAPAYGKARSEDKVESDD